MSSITGPDRSHLTRWGRYPQLVGASAKHKRVVGLNSTTSLRRCRQPMLRPARNTAYPSYCTDGRAGRGDHAGPVETTAFTINSLHLSLRIPNVPRAGTSMANEKSLSECLPCRRRPQRLPVGLRSRSSESLSISDLGEPTSDSLRKRKQRGEHQASTKEPGRGRLGHADGCHPRSRMRRSATDEMNAGGLICSILISQGCQIR